MKPDAVRRMALALPEASEAPHVHFMSFRVGSKVFATAAPTDDALHVFIADDERDRALALHPACTERLLWGGKAPRRLLKDATP